MLESDKEDGSRTVTNAAWIRIFIGKAAANTQRTHGATLRSYYGSAALAPTGLAARRPRTEVLG